MPVLRCVLLLCALFLVASAQANGAHKERIVCICDILHPSLFLADADGKNERPFLEGTGSNYDASFSADGKWILFTSERAGSADIYRAHPDGSGLEHLTDSPAFDDQGALSPDGRTLAFVSTREGGTANIWLLDIASHRTDNLTNGKSGNFRPSWSPDGKWIAFTSDRDTNAGRSDPQFELLQLTALYIVHPNGAGLRRLTPLDQFAGSPKWSPDGRNIVYYKTANIRGLHRQNSIAPGVPQIASVDVETGAEKILTTGDAWKLSPQYIAETDIGYIVRDDKGKTGFATLSGGKSPLSQMEHPSWSPDGKMVVYQKSGFSFSWMKPVAGFDRRYDLVQSAITNDFPAFSPDRSKVIYAEGTKLKIMDANGSNRHDLLESTSPDQQIASVSWSPDGQYIAFGMGNFRGPVLTSQIALIRSDGANLRMLTQGESRSAFPSFSPDSKKIVYRVTGSEQGLRILSLKDGTITKLTTERDNFPSWSPRGDRIVFVSLRTGDYEVHTIQPDGAGLRQLTHDHGNDGHPIWSPDGKWIAFASSRKGWKDEGIFNGGGQPYGEIFVMRADGKDARQLTDNRWEDGPAFWLPPS